MRKPKVESKPLPVGYLAPSPEPETTPRWAKALERHAIAKGWPMPEAKEREIIDRLTGIIDRSTAAGRAAGPRAVVQAAKALLSADLRRQAEELASPPRRGKKRGRRPRNKAG